MKTNQMTFNDVADGNVEITLPEGASPVAITYCSRGEWLYSFATKYNGKYRIRFVSKTGVTLTGDVTIVVGYLL